MKSKKILFAAMVILLMSAFKLTAFAEDVSGYVSSDIAAINNIIDTNSLSGYEKDAPSTWDFVKRWQSNSEGKKYASDVDLSSKSLTGVLDVSGLTGLTYFKCEKNELTGLNVSGLTKLQNIYCKDNKIPSLDLTGLTSLSMLHCSNNALTELNLSGLDKLEYVWCFANNDLTKLNGLEDCTGLIQLYCNECSLTELDLSALTKLKRLTCNNNNLTKLTGIANKAELTEFQCDSNNLKEVDVSGCAKLTTLWVGRNELEEIKGLKDCTALTNFQCLENNLKSLDLSGLPASCALKYTDNNLTEVKLQGGELKIETTTGGTAYITDINTADNKVVLTTNPDAGYIFDGWYTDAAMTEDTKIDFDGTVSGNITLYPKFYSIITNVTVSDLPANITYGDNLELAILGIETSSGYNAEDAVYKWYEGTNDFGVSSASYTYAVGDLNEHTISCDITLGGYTLTKTFTFTASPKVINTKITLTVPSRGSKPQTSIETDEYKATVAWSPTVTNVFLKNTAYTATITITPKTNYTTAGITQYTVTGATSTEIDENSNIKAVFPRTSGGSGGLGGVMYYNVSFETNGGSKVTTQSVMSGTAAKEPAAPTKEGFVFDGWYTDQKLTEKYNFSTKVTKTIKLYAKWTEEDVNANRIILMVGSKNAIVFGETKTSDAAPKVVNDRTMLPARFVAENLGAKVSWDGSKKLVTITGKNEKGSDVTILITIGASTAVVDGKEVTLDSPAFVENDRTYTPIRFISEKLGATVEWDGDNQTVTITKAETK